MSLKTIINPLYAFMKNIFQNKNNRVALSYFFANLMSSLIKISWILVSASAFGQMLNPMSCM